MSANTIITSVVTGGTNNHTTVAEEANTYATDFVSQGVVGAITLNTGSGGIGSFCVNADSTPDMGITVKAGQAYITATPASQDSQVLRCRASADYTAYTINANSSGLTKYDWIYLSVNSTNANVPSAAADNVTSIVTSRSSSNTTDNGSPPTYGLLLAIVTVANAASSITNSNITDKRVNTSIGTQGGSLIVTQQATGDPAIIQAAGQDANINLQLKGKGTGAVDLAIPYKFRVNRTASYNTVSATATRMPYDTKNFDTGTNVDIVTNQGRFTAPIAGFYQFNARWGTGSSTSNIDYIMLYKNGSEVSRGALLQYVGDPGGVTVSDMLQLAANDYIEVFYFSNGIVVTDVGSAFNYFSGFLVSVS